MPLLIALALIGQLAEPVFEKKIADMAAQAGPGVAMTVFRDGKPVYEKAFGLADEATKSPYRLDTSFEIGSLSKQFVGAALLILVNEKKVGLKDPIGKHLSQIPETWRAATIEQVLHHMSGIPDYEEIAGYDFYNKERKPEEIIAEASKKPLDFQPDESFSYSNTGYFLLSMIVEKASGMPAGDFFEKRLFRPVGMTRTYAVHRPAGLSMATGYHSRTGSRVAQPPIAWTSTLGAGGIVSTLEDMNKWDQSLYTKQLLPDNLRNKLWGSAKTKAGDTINYGYGWFSGDFRGLQRKDHSGQTNGFTCYYFRYPAQKTMVMVHTNTYNGRLGGIANILSTHFLPEISYFRMKPMPAGGDSEKHLTMLRTALSGVGSFDDFSPAMKDFSTRENAKATRDELWPNVEKTTAFRLLTKKSVPRGKDEKVDLFIYRQDFGTGTQFWTMRFLAGKLIGFNVEDE